MSQTSPPLLHFHRIHSDDILLSNNNTTAQRYSATHAGLIFSSRPLKPFEKFSFKLSQGHKRSKDLMGIGFTTQPPSENCQTTDIKIRTLKNHSIKNKTLWFYFDNNTIHFGIDDEEKGHFGSKVATDGLWVLMQLLQTQITVEIVNSQAPDFTKFNLVPIPIHRQRGKNVKIRNNEAFKFNRRLNMSYVFTSRPLKSGEYVIIKILTTGCLGLGITDHNPSNLEQKQLPDHFAKLSSIPGTWIIASNTSWRIKQDDVISFLIDENGKLKVWKNDNTLLTSISVDKNSKYWAFFDLATCEGIEIRKCILPVVQNCNTASWNELKNPTFFNEEDSNNSVCVVCCESELEAALYPCGHMCMCYECAREQWMGEGHGRCPMCRMKIKDVLKIFKA